MEWLLFAGIVLYLLFLLAQWLFTTTAGWIVLLVVTAFWWGPFLYRTVPPAARWLVGALGSIALWILRVLEAIAMSIVWVVRFLTRLILLVVVAPMQAVSSVFLSPVSTCPRCSTRKHHEYACPVCRSTHRLTPDLVHGAFRRSCSCGEGLPTLDVLGRARLLSACDTCGTTFETHRGAERHVAFFGALESGRSAAALGAARGVFKSGHRLSRETPPAVRTAVEFADGLRGPFAEGLGWPQALRLIRRGPRGDALYLYDPEGGSRSVSGATDERAFMDHISGLVFVVDTRTGADGAAVGGKNPLLDEDAYARLVGQMHARAGARSPARVRMAVLVVPDQDLGSGATRSVEDAETWLASDGYGPLVRLIRHDFPTARYFLADPGDTGWLRETAAAVRWATA